MQKLDFTTTLAEIVKKLNSQEIVKLFEVGLNTNDLYGYDRISPLIFSSKSSYDSLMSNKKL